MEARAHPEEMRRLLDQFIDLLVARTEKGVINSDPSLSRNFGFLDGRAVEIDFGNYRPVGCVDGPQEIQRYTKKLRKWLINYAPEYIEYLEGKVEVLQ